MKSAFSWFIFIIITACTVIANASERVIMVSADKKNVSVGQPVTLSFTIIANNIDSVRWDNQQLMPSIIVLKQRTPGNRHKLSEKSITYHLTFTQLDSGITVIPSMPIHVYSANSIKKFHSSSLSVYFRSQPSGNFLTIKPIHDGVSFVKSGIILLAVILLSSSLIFLKYYLQKKRSLRTNHDKTWALKRLTELKAQSAEPVNSAKHINNVAYQIFLNFLNYIHPQLITSGISINEVLHNVSSAQLHAEEEKTIRELLLASRSIRFSPMEQPVTNYLTQIEDFINTYKMMVNENPNVH